MAQGQLSRPASPETHKTAKLVCICQLVFWFNVRYYIESYFQQNDIRLCRGAP